MNFLQRRRQCMKSGGLYKKEMGKSREQSQKKTNLHCCPETQQFNPTSFDLEKANIQRLILGAHVHLHEVFGYDAPINSQGVMEDHKKRLTQKSESRLTPLSNWGLEGSSCHSWISFPIISGKVRNSDSSSHMSSFTRGCIW